MATTALQVIKDERLVEKAQVLGEMFRSSLREARIPIVATVRGKGLLNAIVLDDTKMNGRTARHFCLLLKSRGILAKPTHENIVRFVPPLVISEAELRHGIEVIVQSLKDIVAMPLEDIQDNAH